MLFRESLPLWTQALWALIQRFTHFHRHLFPSEIQIEKKKTTTCNHVLHVLSWGESSSWVDERATPPHRQVEIGEAWKCYDKCMVSRQDDRSDDRTMTASRVLQWYQRLDRLMGVQTDSSALLRLITPPLFVAVVALPFLGVWLWKKKKKVLVVIRKGLLAKICRTSTNVRN